MKQVIIVGRLPTLNEMISAMNHNKYVGASMKRKAERMIYTQLKNNAAPLPTGYYCFQWVLKNKRRDPDNVSSATKVILDAFQSLEMLENDGPKQVRGLHHSFCYDLHLLEEFVIVTVCETLDEYIQTIGYQERGGVYIDGGT